MSFTHYACVQRSCFPVDPCQLHDEGQDDARCKKQLADYQSGRKSAPDNGREKENQRENQQQAVEVIFGPEQAEQGFPAHHQSVQVIAFVRHDAGQDRNGKSREAIDGIELDGIDALGGLLRDAEEHGSKKNQDNAHHLEVLARCLVAEDHAQFQPHVFTSHAEAFQVAVAAEVSDAGVFLPSQFAVDAGGLHTAVDQQEQDDDCQYACVGEKVPGLSSYLVWVGVKFSNAKEEELLINDASQIGSKKFDFSIE